MKTGNTLAVIYPTPGGKQYPGTDFCALMAYMSACGLEYQILAPVVNESHRENLENIVIPAGTKAVYFHIDDITYLPGIVPMLQLFKENHGLTIVGGHPSITLQAREILDTFRTLDIVVREPDNEKNLAALIKKIFSNRDWQSVKGITFRSAGNDDRIMVNPSRSLSKNLDHLSNPVFFHGLMPTNKWYPIITGRGCFYDCQYCVSAMRLMGAHDRLTKTRVKKSVKKIVDEIEFFVSKGINKFNFYCDQFLETQPHRRISAVSIAREILARKLETQFKFSAKPREIKNNFDNLFILKEAGMEKIDIGIDSGHGRFNRQYKNGSTVEDSQEVLRFMHEHRWKFDIQFILYDPYLTLEEIKETIEFLKRIGPYFSHLELPYCAYLDSRVLNSVLLLRHGMPIIPGLRKDNLVVEPPGFSAHPAAKFLDPGTKYVYSIYRVVNDLYLPKTRHFFYDWETVKKHDFLNLFPLKILEKILELVQEKKLNGLQEYVTKLGEFIKESFGDLHK